MTDDHEARIGEALAESNAWDRVEAALPDAWLVALELHTVSGVGDPLAIEWHVVVLSPVEGGDDEYDEEWRATGPTRREALSQAADTLEQEE